MRRVAPFDPTQISGCQLWLDAADSSTITFSSGTSVSQWNDKSGLNNHALQGTTANQPSTYISANGLTGMNFGLSNFFRGSFSSPITGTTLSAFIILNMNSSTYNYGRALSLSTNNNNDYLAGAGGTNISRNSTNVALWQEAFGGSGTAGPFSINTSTTYLIDSMFDGTTHIAYLNASNVASVATSTNFSIYLFGIGFQAYQLVSASSDYWIGYINEVVIYNTALTEAQRKNVEGYLAQKWGLRSNLPGGHTGLTSAIYPTPRIQFLTPMSYTTNIFNVARPAPLANQYPTPITNAYFVSNAPPSYRVINLNSYTYGSVTSGTFTMNSVLGGGSITFTGSDVFASSSTWGPQQLFDNIRTDYDWATSGNPPFGQFVFPRPVTMTKLFIVPRNQQDNFPATFTLIVDTVTIGTYSNTTISAAQGLSVSFTGTGFYVQPNVRGTTWLIQFPTVAAWIGEIEFYGYV
jgi:hypothetical protein